MSKDKSERMREFMLSQGVKPGGYQEVYIKGADGEDMILARNVPVGMPFWSRGDNYWCAAL